MPELIASPACIRYIRKNFTVKGNIWHLSREVKFKLEESEHAPPVRDNGIGVASLFVKGEVEAVLEFKVY